MLAPKPLEAKPHFFHLSGLIQQIFGRLPRNKVAKALVLNKKVFSDYL
jgi:hypothetical protein